MRKELMREGAPVRQELRATGSSGVIRVWMAIRPTQAIVCIGRIVYRASLDRGTE